MAISGLVQTQKISIITLLGIRGCSIFFCPTHVTPSKISLHIGVWRTGYDDIYSFVQSVQGPHVKLSIGFELACNVHLSGAVNLCTICTLPSPKLSLHLYFRPTPSNHDVSSFGAQLRLHCQVLTFLYPCAAPPSQPSLTLSEKR